MTDAPKPVVITRSKNYAPPGSCRRFAWKWVYRVEDPRLPCGYTNYDHLESLRGYLKRQGLTFVHEWKGEKA